VAKLTITLTRDAGRTDVYVDYQSDDDALPYEHEVEHRRRVAELFPGLVFTEDKNAAVRVERERPAQEPVVG
jgi:hypothetical protein